MLQLMDIVHSTYSTIQYLSASSLLSGSHLSRDSAAVTSRSKAASLEKIKFL